MMMFRLATVMMLVAVGVTTPVVASVVDAPHLPSIGRMRRATTNDGKVDTSPSQISSRGSEPVAYAEDPEREERSNGSEEANGSNTLGVGGAARGMPLIALTSKAIAAVRSTLVAMLLRSNDLARTRVTRLLMVDVDV